MSNTLYSEQNAAVLTPALPKLAQTTEIPAAVAEVGLASPADPVGHAVHRIHFRKCRFNKFDAIVEWTMLGFAAAPAIGLMFLLGNELVARLF